MEEEKHKTSILFKILIVLFFAFLIIYISKETGYYEYRAYNKRELTSEAIKKFESDVKEGKDVSLKDYVKEGYVDYSNFVSEAGSNIGNAIETFMNKGIQKTMEFFSALFYK